jgi:RNA polymerase subunit RPABC4/transcription elongation factor Spt4
VDELFDQFLADPTVTAIGGAVGAALVALWLAAAWWAYTDATRRTDNTPAAMLAAAWIIVSTPLFVPFALAVYALARPQHSAAEHRTRRLAEELVDTLEEIASAACRSCGTSVEDGWLRCPSCAGWLALPCRLCGSWSDGTLAVCPYCGGEERGEAAVEVFEPAAAAGRARRGRRQLRATGPGRPAASRPVQRRPFEQAPRRPTEPDGRPLAPVRAP